VNVQEDLIEPPAEEVPVTHVRSMKPPSNMKTHYFEARKIEQMNSYYQRMKEKGI